MAKISGIVMEKLEPTSKCVCLFSNKTKELIDSIKSDPITGKFEFDVDYPDEYHVIISGGD